MKLPRWTTAPRASNPLDQPSVDLTWALFLGLLVAWALFSPVVATVLPAERLVFIPIFLLVIVGAMASFRAGYTRAAVGVLAFVFLARTTMVLGTGQVGLGEGMAPVVVAGVGALTLMVGPVGGVLCAAWVTAIFVAASQLTVPLGANSQARTLVGYAFAYGLLGAVTALSARGVRLARAQAVRRSQASERAAAQAQRARADLDGLFAALPDAVLLVDESNLVVFANPETVPLFGIDLEGRPLPEALSRGQDAVVVEDVVGVERRLAVSRGEVTRTGGERATAWVLQDVTERERAKERAARAATLASDTERAKAAFLANLSHELRTPMNAIVGYAGLLEEDSTDTDRTEVLHNIQSAGSDLLALVSDLLDLARLDAGAMPIAERDVPLASIVDRLSAVIPVSAPPHATVHTDPDQLLLLLKDLQDASLELGAQNRASLAISASGPRLSVALTLLDPGVEADALFDPLGPAGRAGLTLALAMRRAESLGGDFRADVAPYGVEIHVEWRRTTPPRSDSASPKPAATPAP